MNTGYYRLTSILAVIPITALAGKLFLEVWANLLNLGPEPKIIFPIVAITLLAYYTVPNIGIVYLLLWGITIWLGWRKSERTNKRTIVLTFYLVTLALFLSYIIWWYATSQEFVYL